MLDGLQGEIFREIVGGKQLLDNYDLIPYLAEADQKITMRRRSVDFITQLGQRGAGGLEPLRGRESQQRRFICRADEIEFVRHAIDWVSLKPRSRRAVVTSV